jgi:hypothetical protein
MIPSPLLIPSHVFLKSRNVPLNSYNTNIKIRNKHCVLLTRNLQTPSLSVVLQMLFIRKGYSLEPHVTFSYLS